MVIDVIVVGIESFEVIVEVCGLSFVDVDLGDVIKESFGVVGDVVFGVVFG